MRTLNLRLPSGVSQLIAQQRRNHIGNHACMPYTVNMMKDNILFFLRQQPDTFVSGADISRTLGVTRTSVWKNIKALQQEGYAIDAVTNRGYRLTACPPFLDETEVKGLLTTTNLGRHLTLYESVDSTNRQALRAAEAGAPHGAVFAAREQTAGQGRLGRGWYSPRHTCLMMSLLLRPRIAVTNASPITLVMGLAVCQALQDMIKDRVAPGTLGIKWPNDIIINGRKAVGILTELTAEVDQIKALTIGVGVNIQVPSFPPELAASATSLLLETGQIYSFNTVAAAILNAFEPLYEVFLQEKFAESILPLYRQNCVTLEQNIRAIRNTEEIHGRAVTINADGELVVALPSGKTLSLNSGEVSVRGMMGYAE